MHKDTRVSTGVFTRPRRHRRAEQRGLKKRKEKKVEVTGFHHVKSRYDWLLKRKKIEDTTPSIC